MAADPKRPRRVPDAARCLRARHTGLGGSALTPGRRGSGALAWARPLLDIWQERVARVACRLALQARIA